MARGISEIKKGMTDEFMKDEAVREMYGIEQGKSFSDCFSVVSVENVLFYVVAACCHVMELLFDSHKTEVEKLAEGAVVASVPWYHKMALMYQHGDALVLDETTQRYGYAVEDDRKRVVRYAAVRDRDNSVLMLVAGEKEGAPVQLDDEVLEAFTEYMNRVKVAGVKLAVYSRQADVMRVTANVYVDPLVIDKTGVRIADGSKPVEEAVKNYFKGILYGGVFNKTKLVDAIQAVEGVDDVELVKCECRAENGEFVTITGNTHTAYGGCFVVSGLEETLSYVAQG